MASERMPELEVVSSIFTSSSNTKSPYSFSVTKNVLGVLGTVIYLQWRHLQSLYSAEPVIFFKPLKVFPSNKFDPAFV